MKIAPKKELANIQSTAALGWKKNHLGNKYHEDGDYEDEKINSQNVDKEMELVETIFLQPRLCSILIERASPQNTKSISLEKLNIPGMEVDLDSDLIFQNKTSCRTVSSFVFSSTFGSPYFFCA